MRAWGAELIEFLRITVDWQALGPVCMACLLVGKRMICMCPCQLRRRLSPVRMRCAQVCGRRAGQDRPVRGQGGRAARHPHGGRHRRPHPAHQGRAQQLPLWLHPNTRDVLCQCSTRQRSSASASTAAEELTWAQPYAGPLRWLCWPLISLLMGMIGTCVVLQHGRWKDPEEDEEDIEAIAEERLEKGPQLV